MIKLFKKIIFIIIILLILNEENVNLSDTPPPQPTSSGDVRPDVSPLQLAPPPVELACTLNTCSVRGEPCSSYTNSSSRNRNSGFTCLVEDRCLNGTCVQSLGAGEMCTTSDDCNLGYSCVTPLNTVSLTLPNRTKICQLSFYAEYGDGCTRATDCLNSLDCINNTCSTPQYGCLSDLQCRNDSICNFNGTCVLTPLKEGECYMARSFRCNNPSNNPCALKTFNVSSIGVCLDHIPLGNPCITTKLSCDFTTGQICRPLTRNSVIGKCVPTPIQQVLACTTQFNCRPYEYCKCDAQSGVGYCVTSSFFFGKYCKAAASLFLECYRESNCSQPFSLNPNSCIRKSHCAAAATCLYQFCLQPLLPIQLCTNKVCDLTIFDNLDVRVLNNTNSIIRSHFILLNTFIFLIIVVMIL